MNDEPKSKFTFSAYGMTFGPYDTFEIAATEAAAYAKRVYELSTDIVKLWPRVTIDELRPPAH